MHELELRFGSIDRVFAEIKVELGYFSFFSVEIDSVRYFQNFGEPFLSSSQRGPGQSRIETELSAADHNRSLNHLFDDVGTGEELSRAILVVLDIFETISGLVY